MSEAMPFDRIAVRMYRSSVSERGIKFYFDFSRLTKDGKRHKLGYGEHEAGWFTPNKEGEWVPTILPPALRNSVIPKDIQDHGSRFSFKQKDKNQEYDVTIVGAGIGGLTAGSLLAKQGMRVLVLEHHDKPGGFCTSFKRIVKHDNKKLRFIFDAGVHDICGLDRNIGKLLRELDIEDRIEWLRVGHEYITPEFRLKVPLSMKDYIDELGKRFPDEKGSLVSFFREIEICYRELLKIEPYDNSYISKWMNVPFTKMLDTFFHDDQLKKIMSILHCYIGDDVQNINTLTMIPLFYYYLFGGHYPSGGSQVFPDALVSAIENHNGKVQLLTAVSRILIEDGRASGVELANGEIIRSHIVISNADIRRTFLDLVGHSYLPSYFSRRIENLQPSNSAFQLFLGVDFVPDLESVTMMIEKNEMLAIMISSNVDPSLAPPGHACIALIMLSPHEQAHSWDRSDPGYTKRKKQFGDRIIALAEKTLPNLREHIVYRQDASPATFARYAWTTSGAIYGLAIDEWRPSMISPIEGLYLTGASVSARPGVEDAVYTGITVAEEIIKKKQNKECLTCII
jgi:phytoene dehydrogenase-like protein